MAFIIEAAVVCSIGCVRGNNEDNFYFLGDYLQLDEMNDGAHIVHMTAEPRQIYAILDGVGGSDSGECASVMAAKALHSCQETIFEDPEKETEKYASETSRQIYKEAVRMGARNMGTTMALLCLHGKEALAANVGDSRVYRLRDGKLELLTKDHSYVYQMYLANKLTLEQARKHRMNNVITRYLGMDPEKMPIPFVYEASHEIQCGDRYMLCSDGVCDLLSQEELQKILSRPHTADQTATELVSLSLELGGKDNTTCIVLDVKKDTEQTIQNSNGK